MIDLVARKEPSLYETDFYAWTQRQAALMRSGCLADVDLVNVLEEIETLGRGQINALRSRYAILTLHLLKLIVQPRLGGRSWRLTIAEQRIQVARLLADSPGLKSKRQALFDEGYEDGRKLCAAETGLSLSAIPISPPFTVEQAEDEAWRPSLAD